MTGEDNLSGFILGSIKAEIDVHISAPQSDLPVTAGTPEIHPAGIQVRLERGKAWVTPLCVLLSLLLLLVTADFKLFIFEPLIWRIIYKILTVAAFIWLLFSIYGSIHGIPLAQRLKKIKAKTGLIMKHQNKIFSGKKINLDFNEFVGCQFEDCEFIYHGAGRVEMSGCEFTNVTWKFSDGAANTLSFMRAMYHGAGKGGQELVDRVFQNLKQP